MIEHGEKDRQAREVRDALIESNLRLVLKIANDFIGRGLEWDDLVSEGNRGLVNAAGRFDPSRGAKFSTYSAWWIKQAIRQAIADSQVVHAPIGTQLNRSRVRRKEQQMTKDSGGIPPGDSELANALNLPEATVKRLRVMQPVEMRSLNECVGDDADTELQHLMADDSAASPDQELTRIEEIEQLLELLDTLLERERQVIRLRFGLDGEPVLTLDEVGRVMGCSSERVRQIQERALRKLHKRISE